MSALSTEMDTSSGLRRTFDDFCNDTDANDDNPAGAEEVRQANINDQARVGYLARTLNWFKNLVFFRRAVS